MSEITWINSLLPDGFFAHFQPAECESVDSQFAIFSPNNKDTEVAIQICDGYCVSYFDEANGELWHWTPRDHTQSAGLRSDILKALKTAGALS